MGIRVGIDLKLEPRAAFDALVGELSLALAGLGMQLEPGTQGHLATESGEVARIVGWEPGKRIVWEWRQADWQTGEATTLEFRFEPIADGTRITLERGERGNLIGEEAAELAGWFASEVAGSFLRAMAPTRLGDWITDRRSRCPAGPQARAFYRDPLYHRPNFRAILSVLKLTPSDFLLDIGCGGGAFLEEALRSGCRAAALDHSADMVAVARDLNRESIRGGKLEIRQAEADSLPYADGTFTCAVTTGVFAFLAAPREALAETWRVLAPGGRFVLFTASEELRGTPAAPEPIASRLHFYEDHELMELARQAGFGDARIERPDFERLAREAGVPEEHLALFRGRSGGQLLLASKPQLP